MLSWDRGSGALAISGASYGDSMAKAMGVITLLDVGRDFGRVDENHHHHHQHHAINDHDHHHYLHHPLHHDAEYVIIYLCIYIYIYVRRYACICILLYM